MLVNFSALASYNISINNTTRKVKKMTKTTIIVAVGLIAAAVIAVPALKGPFNRFRNEANVKLNAEYVVDNYKAEYVALHEKRGKVVESISKFNVEKAVAAKKLALAKDKTKIAKETLVKTGTADLKAFARAKDAYEVANTEVENFKIMVGTYAKAVKKLEQSLSLIDSNMAKAKLNVDTLSSKKVMLDTIKAVNKSIENMNGVGDSDLAVNVEKLDDDMLRESIKLEALNKDGKPVKAPLTEADARAYLDSLK